MLQIKKLNLTHKKDLRIILNDFNLVLNDGDKAVIIGEEGNGKSTLMKWIYNPSLVENYIEADGERIMGHERLGYLPQEMLDEDKEKTIYEYFSEEEIFWEKTPKELSVIAGKFGMKNDFFYSNQTMGSLSGGEKVKTQLMRLFIRDVSVLLLDEPSNDIDIATLTLLEKIINDWKHIVLFISHDETLIERTANMVIHIEQIIRKTKARYTVAKLPYRRYVEERLHKFEIQKQRALSDRREKKIRDEKYQRVKFDMISGTNGLLGAADGAFLLQKEKRTDGSAILDVAGRDQQDQRMYLTKDKERLVWELERLETEPWVEPPDPVLEAVAALVTADRPAWGGTATELAAALQTDMKPNALAMRLNVRAGRLAAEYHIRYENSRSHAGRSITLTLEPPQA